jgi:hypothetical protein
MVELPDAMERAGRNRQGPEGGVHSMEPVEGAMLTCVRQQRTRRHETSRPDHARRSSMARGMALHCHGRW